jgi:hypothetical protein
MREHGSMHAPANTGIGVTAAAPDTLNAYGTPPALPMAVLNTRAEGPQTRQW